MVIELRGVEFVNKGAELMLQAIMHKVKQEIPDVIFVMEQTARVPVDKMTQYNIYKKAIYVKKGTDLANFVYGFIPKSVRRKRSLILPKEIDIVFDGSGFAFGDQWGVDYANRRLGRYLKLWKREGKKVVLLPQAFGPFSSPALKSLMKDIVTQADLIFAREDQSYEYLNGIVENAPNVFKSPDFTNLIKGTIPKDFDAKKHNVAIIPNYKMLEKRQGEGDTYAEFLIHVIKNVQAKGLNPYFLIHEGERDQKIAEEINGKLEKPIDLFTGLDALTIKGVISSAYFIVCSRFHGVVSALSQGVPCMVTSWSHKYEMLVKEYEFEAGLLKVLNDFTFIDNLLEKLADPKENKLIVENLIKNSLIQKKRSEETWKTIFKLIK